MCLLALISTQAQKKPAYVKGLVLNENDAPLSQVSITILGQQKGIATIHNRNGAEVIGGRIHTAGSGGATG